MIIIHRLRGHNPAYLQGMNIDGHIGVEIGSHGKDWDGLHGGYFSNLATAKPLLETIIQHLKNTQPDTLIDLGGGTGFILSQLDKEEVLKDTTLINMDCSKAQLDAASTPRIECINGSIDSFNRKDLVQDYQKIFFIMRSALHYADKSGLLPVLKHIHSQMNSGEMFVHQTASFEEEAGRNCINALYQKMRTQKWYPLVTELNQTIKEAGFELIEAHSAPSLKMTSDELAERYKLSDKDILNIKDELLQEFDEIKNIFEITSEGFTAYLPYEIYTTKAL